MRRDLSIHEWKILRRVLRDKNKGTLGKDLKNLVLSRKIKKGGLLAEMVTMGLLVRSPNPVAGVQLTPAERDGGAALTHTYTATPIGVTAAEVGDYEYEVVRDRSDRIVGYKAVADKPQG